MKTIRLLFLSLLFVTIFCPRPALPAETGTAAYAALLKTTVTADGVRWDKIGATEKKLLGSFLDWIAATNPVALEDTHEQLAFWINAHNACVMKFVLDHLPVQSVMAISGFRDQLKCKVAGSEHSLVDLESSIVRPLFNEPRVHFALWWGTKGGPRLREMPYEGATLEKALEEASRSAITNPLFVKFDPSNPAKPVALSVLFDWYKLDFGKKDQDLLSFIRARVAKENTKKIPGALSKVSFMSFDWTLDRAN
ncbi:MAG: DUF547 domain-containing protein [Pseudomonadota bacterium]